MDFIHARKIRFNKKGKKFVRHLLKFIDRIHLMSIKEIEPILCISDNNGNLFMDIEYINEWRKDAPFNEHYYGILALAFCKDVFLFDVKSCDFLWQRDNNGN